MVSAEKLAALVESLGAIVWEADGCTFQFTLVSGQVEAILGYPRSEWLADPQFWRNHTHPDDVARCTTFCLDATARGRDHSFEYRMIAADGRVVWLRDVVTVNPRKWFASTSSQATSAATTSKRSGAPPIGRRCSRASSSRSAASRSSMRACRT